MDNNFDNLFGNIFGDLFSSAYSAADWEKDLNEYWQSYKIEVYYKTLNNCKANGFRVLRNSEGIHKVKRR